VSNAKALMQIMSNNNNLNLPTTPMLGDQRSFQLPCFTPQQGLLAACCQIGITQLLLPFIATTTETRQDCIFTSS
jgi:hypothetical protein